MFVFNMHIIRAVEYLKIAVIAVYKFIVVLMFFNVSIILVFAFEWVLTFIAIELIIFTDTHWNNLRVIIFLFNNFLFPVTKFFVIYDDVIIDINSFSL